MNKTFEDLQIIQELNEAWLEVGPQIKSYMETSVEVKMLQVRLSLTTRGKSEIYSIFQHFSVKIMCLCMCLRQDLLRQPEIAVLVNLRLEDTPWTASRITRFLSTPSPDIPRRPGAPLTWLDIYNDINQTISTLAQVTEVLLLCCYLFLNINKIEK